MAVGLPFSPKCQAIECVGQVSQWASDQLVHALALNNLGQGLHPGQQKSVHAACLRQARAYTQACETKSTLQDLAGHPAQRWA